MLDSLATEPKNLQDLNEQFKKKSNSCLVYIGDEMLPSCVGNIINHCKDPY